jgi:hypothetical protein
LHLRTSSGTSSRSKRALQHREGLLEHRSIP